MLPLLNRGLPYGERHALLRIRATVETGSMLLPEARIDKTLEETLARALGEFCPAWKIASDCSPVDPFDPSHWATDTQSCQVTLRHRVTGRLTVLGRRIADEPSTRLHRGVALSLIEAYGRGDADPLRRYLEEIGVTETMTCDAGHFFHRPSVSTSQGVSSGAAEGLLNRDASCWRPETPRPALPDTAAGSDVEEAPDERSGGTLLRTVLRKLRRDVELWQWRRTYGRRHP